MQNMVRVLGLICFCVFEICHSASYWAGYWQGDSAWNDLPYCMRTDEPCDQAVKRFRRSSRESDVIYSTENAICGCPNGNGCPSGFSTGGPKTLSFKDTADKVAVSFHYCEPIPNARQCSGEEVAMIMEGGIIPETIRTVNCRCPLDTPMRVKKSYFEGWKRVKELVCDLPVCTINDANGAPYCQHFTRVRNPVTWMITYPTTVLCECPKNYECVRGQNTGNEFYGSCQAVRG